MPNRLHTSACHGQGAESPGWKALQGVAILAEVSVSRDGLPLPYGPATALRRHAGINTFSRTLPANMGFGVNCGGDGVRQASE